MAKEFSKPFYRSRQWRQVRDYCLMRDRYLCQKCGRPAEEVHHKEHLTPGNIMDARVSLDPENLVSLCKDCHFMEHREDQAAGRTRRYMGNALPKVVFDERGNPVPSPRGQEK